MLNNLPSLVAAADWGSHPRKRWLALAHLGSDRRYRAEAPRLVEDPRGLLRSLKDLAAPGGAVLVGFDFPIGLPIRYARKAGLSSFLDLLAHLNEEEWAPFSQVAEIPSQISLRRPFYPLRPGQAQQTHLLTGLGMQEINDLRRECDLAHPGRRAACPLFWTLGSQQVGKAALHGWKEVLFPGFRYLSPGLSIWPFSGRLAELLKGRKIIAAETYPAEYYAHLGIHFSPRRAGRRSGKRFPHDRSANAPTLFRWAEAAGVILDAPLQLAIEDGFGLSPDGEDPFDATIGLFGLLNLLLGLHEFYEPESANIRKIEGWILGQCT